MATTSNTTKLLKQLPVNRFSVLDNAAIEVARLGVGTAEAKRATAELPAKVANAVRTITAKKPISSARDLVGLVALGPAQLEGLQRRVLFPNDPRLVITDVVPVGNRIMSNRPFALRMSFASSAISAPVLASVHVEWTGEPFVVEKLITPKEARSGSAVIQFNRKQTLPTGPAVFHLTAFSGAGAQANFRVTCAVLPSNPFSLGLSPNASFVTGHNENLATPHIGSLKQAHDFVRHFRCPVRNRF